MMVRGLRVALFAASALALLIFADAAVRLLTRPEPLDPVERVVVERAARVAEGGALQVEPAQLVDPPVMPGFPFASALVMRLFGEGPAVPRGLALVAALLVAALALVVIHLETGSWTLSVSGAGFALMGHALLAGPPGLARPESVMLALLLLGCLTLRRFLGAGGAIAAAVPFSAAYFVDPQAAWFVAAALLSLASDGRRRLAVFALTIAALLGGGYVALSQVLGPWFNYDAWDGPLATARLSGADPLHFVGDHLLGRLGVATLAAVLTFAMPTPPWRGPGGLWTCMGIAALAAGLAATQSAGWGPCALLPSVVALSILGPISMQRVTRHLSAWPGSSRLGGQGVVLAAVALQFVVFFANVPPR